jgi:hypothetical protein
MESRSVAPNGSRSGDAQSAVRRERCDRASFGTHSVPNDARSGKPACVEVGYRTRMADFEVPADLTFNRGAIADPEAFAHDAGAASWLFLCGEQFAAMDGGMSYSQVQAAVPESENIVSDPPTVLDIELARQHLAALDRLPRPTLVTCRAGPRSSAVVYLYAGLRAGASADEVLARADADGAPFAGFDDLRTFVAQGLEELAPSAQS